MSGVGSGSSPYNFSVTALMLADCLEPYMNNLGFDLEIIDSAPKFVVPPAIPAGYHLIADGAGGSSWQAP